MPRTKGQLMSLLYAKSAPLDAHVLVLICAFFCHSVPEKHLELSVDKILEHKLPKLYTSGLTTFTVSVCGESHSLENNIVNISESKIKFIRELFGSEG